MKEEWNCACEEEELYVLTEKGMAYLALIEAGFADVSEEKLNRFWSRFEELRSASGQTCETCAVPHNQWTGCPKLGGRIPPEGYSCDKWEEENACNEKEEMV